MRIPLGYKFRPLIPIQDKNCIKMIKYFCQLMNTKDGGKCDEKA